MCFYCHSKITKKNGKKAGKQLYKCHVCGKQFTGGNRIDVEKLWDEYQKGKQSYKQLSIKYSCSIKTIQRKLDKFTMKKKTSFPSVANVLMDTTYFGRKFGVMVFKDSLSGTILFKQYVRYETNSLYLSGIKEIVRRGISIQSIICDGRKGLFSLFGYIPVQMCQFHQIQIVLRYLTRKPKHQANVELKKISLSLTKSSQLEFEKQLDDWYIKWKEYYNERSISITTNKSFYTHKRLRSAYLSLRRNLPYLFVFEEYKELDIPNTTNALDGIFSELKRQLRNHNGLSLKRKQKYIDGFFEA